MAFQQVMKKPLVLAGKEFAFAAGSFYASSKVVSYTYAQLLSANFIVKPDDRDERLKVGVGLETIEGVLSIAFYGGLSKLTEQKLPGKTSLQLFPSFPHRPPIPIPHAIVAGCLTLALSPLACVFIGVVKSPVIELLHSDFKINPKAEEKTIKIDKDTVGCSQPVTHVPAHNDGTTASAEPMPSMETPGQISVGTKMGPMVEAAVPGSVTIMAPLSEEMFCRGLLFGRLVPSIGFLPAALCSSAFFGWLHKGFNGSTYFPVGEMITGFACSLSYFHTGRLLVPIALHSGLNSCMMLASAMQSAPLIVGVHRLMSRYKDEVLASTPLLSFWERRVAENFSAFDFVESLLVSWLMNDENTSQDGPLFLPLDFWGAKEPASPQSVFFDRQNNRLLKAPALCNADGSITEFAEFLIGAFLDCMFGDEELISVDDLIDYNISETKLQFAFHILATTAEQADSQPQVTDCFNYCKSLEGEQHDKFFTRLYRTVGYTVLSHPSGKITRSELKEMCSECIRFGFYSDANESLFIFYCFMRMTTEENLSVPDLLKEYCNLPSAMRRHAEEVKQAV